MVALLVALGVVAVGQPDPSTVGGASSDRKTVTIQGRTLEIYPAATVRKRGIRVRDVPADRNAAWVYVDAINAYVAPPRELHEAYVAAMDGNWPDGDEDRKSVV